MQAASAFFQELRDYDRMGIGRARTRGLARKIMAIPAEAAEAFSA